MSIEKLFTQDFRNLNDSSVKFHPEFNFFIGDNGSGKSSLLEAIFFLGHGKSFRTTKTDNLVCYEKPRFVISIKDNEYNQLGVSKDIVSGQIDIKVNGERKTRLSDLVKYFAVQIVTPESFKLFFGGPKERRKFIDLGMFHVEHTFPKQWREFNKILKQRNACIRNGLDSSSMEFWTNLFCEHSELVASSRAKYVDELVLELFFWLNILLPKITDNISVQYLAGWNQKKRLQDLLTSNREREIAYGYSLYGAQKFDVRFLLGKQPLESQLSRGQQKLFLLALTFAQAKLIEKVKRVKPILLIDDIGAELDEHSRNALSKAINKIDCQIFITAIENRVLDSIVPNNDNYQMFHVKHGEISAIRK